MPDNGSAPGGQAVVAPGSLRRGSHAPFHRRGRDRRAPAGRHHHLAPRLHLGPAAVPLRAQLGADRRAPWRRHDRLPLVGGGPRAGQPLRAAGARGAHRAAAVLDDGPLRRDHQRHRDLAHVGHRPDQDRDRGRAGPAVVIVVAAALYTALSTVADAVLGLNRPDLGADRSRGIWGFLESLPTPRRNAIIENLRLQQVYNAIYTTSLDIALADTPDRTAPSLVRTRGARRDGRTRGGQRTGADRGDAPAARPDLREDRPDDGQPGRHPAAPNGSPSSRSSRARPRRSPTRTWWSIVTKELGRTAGGAVRDVRPDARSRPHRRPRSTRRGCTTGRSSRSRSSGRGSRPRPRPTSGSSRSSPTVAERRFGVARKVGLRGSSPSSRRASSRSSTIATRRTTPAVWPTAWPRFPEIHVPIVCDELSGQRVITMEFVNGIKISKADELREARLRHDGARDRLHPRDHQAGPGRRLLPRRPAPGQHPRRPELEADHLPRPRARRAAQRAAARRPARPDLLDQGSRHPGDRRRAARAREADAPVRRGGAPRRHRSPRPSVPDLRQGDLARLGARGVPRRPCSTTACGSTAS